MTTGASPISVCEAIIRITSDVEPLASERVALEYAQGRTLARNLAATLTQPPFAVSAMDGYATRSADMSPNPPGSPIRLTVIGESSAGRGFPGGLTPGQAIRIFTGAALPQNADAVVMQEYAHRDGDVVEILRPAKSGDFIRPEGFDFHSGDVLLHAGQKLTARDLVLAASMNHASLPVRREPVVAILATGDELATPGCVPGPWQIISSTSYGLAAMVRSAGGNPKLLGVARDSLDSLDAKLAEAKDADILLTVGGAADGDYDLVHESLSRRGFIASFRKVAMQPGKSTIFGRIGSQRVLAAPGNPAAALMCARVFLYPLIGALLGAPTPVPSQTTAVLSASLPTNGERQLYTRAIASTGADGVKVAAPLRSQDSSQTTLLSRANCLIVRAPFAAAVDAGRPVQVLDIDF
jgi:molybdopterin molybdotransferase